RALDNVGAAFSIISSGIYFIEMVHPDKAMRDASHDGMLKLRDFSIDMLSRVDLYMAFKSYIDLNLKESLKAGLVNDEEKYFLQETMKGFLRAGLNLPEKELDEVKRLKKELGNLTSEFSRNIAIDKSSIAVDRDALKGTSESFINSLSKDDDGKYILTCAYPTVSEVGKHCSVRSTRKALRTIYLNRAYPVNKKILEDIIAKRDELAKRLGFASYAHFDLDDQMAKTPECAEAFIRDLAKKAEPKEQAEFDRLISDLPAGVSLVEGKFETGDLAYVEEYYKKKHFSLDDREVAEYFTMEKTIEGVFAIYQEFLGLEFSLVKPKGLWHEEASVIEIRRRGTAPLGITAPLGYIFLDLHPRDDKYSHACCCDFVSPVHAIDGLPAGPSVAAVVANFPKSTEDRPSLLKHNDVETFFHEFGHAMHQILGRTKMHEFAGYATKTDFVEVPSQMFEEWMWNKEILQKVSSHYKTGESLPDSLIDKMIELKQFDTGYFVQGQSMNALLSLAYFGEGEKKATGCKDLDKIYKDLYEKQMKHVLFDPTAHMYASFGHLTGYAAKYYSYLWSKVFSLDLFDNICSRNGLLDESVGREFVDKVLGKGGSVEPDQLLRDFLGREPNQKAFLKDLGIDA
ncbi:Zn-dependent oligopeptidase, partial [Candidatus Babeliales bacterium]|nr:Zn-dependent oligopeptidase [Candidatus Babeliales bacterium]